MRRGVGGHVPELVECDSTHERPEGVDGQVFEEAPKIDVPVLVVHGTEGRILPFESTAKRLPDLVSDPTLIPVAGRPAQHRLDAARGDANKALLDFLADDQRNRRRDSAVAAASRPRVGRTV